MEKERYKETSTYAFKGFAYAKGQDKATVVLGKSKEEILNKLKAWNRARTPEKQFKSCNIGTLDRTSKLYGNYRKYDLEGRDISNIYLVFPQMSKEAFSQVVAEIKKNGAKFNPLKKAWYIRPDADVKLFSKYIPWFSEPEIIRVQDVLEEIGADQTEMSSAADEIKLSDLPEFEVIPQYVIKFKDGRENIYMNMEPGDMERPEEVVNRIAHKVHEIVNKDNSGKSSN